MKIKTSELIGAQLDWAAVMSVSDGLSIERGPTPLVAAMRCYVASKLGEYVDIPDELI